MSIIYRTEVKKNQSNEIKEIQPIKLEYCSVGALVKLGTIYFTLIPNC